MTELAKILSNPEERYPGNFDTPQRANALLTGLCQDAATEIERLNAEVLEQCRINGMSADREDALRAELTRLKAIIAIDKMAENACELGLDYEPAVQEGRDWSLLEATQESLREHMAEIKRLKAAQPAPVHGYEHWEGRIKELMKQVGMPDSASIAAAMKQLVNEMAQPAAQPAVQEHLPIAMKTHGAWDGLELLDDLPDGALLYTTTPPAAPAQSCYCPNCEALAKELAALKAQPAPAPGYCKHCKQYTIEEPLTAAQPGVKEG
jgi:hypothetical protein